MTEVLNLNTGETYTYDLPPEKAVICAYEQYERKNRNTWAYDFSETRLTIGKHTVACGNCSALKKGDI
jgi:hypothetical protein